MLELKWVFRLFWVTIICFRVHSSTGLSAQNLLPDGSFEETVPFDYDFPFAAFEFLQHWNTASFQHTDPALVTTPDLFLNGVVLPPTTPLTFWNIVQGAADGSNYVGLTNIATQDGAFLPETIATELTEQLTPGAFYTISLAYRNKGPDNISPDPMLCIEEDQKKLIFYFDEQPIGVTQDQVANTSYSSTDQFVEIRTASMTPYQLSGWENIGTCFQAAGNEKYMALSMTTGRVEVYPPCTLVDESFDVFLHYYFDVDNIRLERIPEAFQVATTICNDRPVQLNLRDSLALPPMLTPIAFTFNGESTDGVIEVERGGIYQAFAQLDCTAVPIKVEVTELDCTPAHYTPNVFSPNFDGRNDEWQVFFKSGMVTTDFKLTIFDRWGAVVFETQDRSEGWEGTTRNREATAGIYSWVLQYTFIHPELGPIPQRDQGDLFLIR